MVGLDSGRPQSPIPTHHDGLEPIIEPLDGLELREGTGNPTKMQMYVKTPQRTSNRSLYRILASRADVKGTFDDDLERYEQDILSRDCLSVRGTGSRDKLLWKRYWLYARHLGSFCMSSIPQIPSRIQFIHCLCPIAP